MFRGLKYKFFNSKYIEKNFYKYNKSIKDAPKGKEIDFENICHYLSNSININLNYNPQIIPNENIVQISSYNTVCGIADFASALKRGLDNLQINNSVLPLDLNITKHANINDYKQYLKGIIKELSSYTTIIIQHEFSLFNSIEVNYHDNLDLFINFVSELRNLYQDKNIILYIHTVPPYYDKTHSYFFNKIKTIPNIKYIVNSIPNLVNLLFLGITPVLSIDPIKQISDCKINQETYEFIKKQLNILPTDKIIGALGFINHFKRYDHMIEVLKELPDNYKLLIVGGTPNEESCLLLDKINKKIKEYKLESRVYITGLYEAEDLYTYLNLIDFSLSTYDKSFKFGSGAITTLLSAEKPVIAYDIDSFRYLNKLVKNVQPLMLVEYDNAQELISTILSLSTDDTYTKQEKNVKAFNSLLNENLLAKLVLSAAEQKGAVR